MCSVRQLGRSFLWPNGARNVERIADEFKLECWCRFSIARLSNYNTADVIRQRNLLYLAGVGEAVSGPDLCHKGLVELILRSPNWQNIVWVRLVFEISQTVTTWDSNIVELVGFVNKWSHRHVRFVSTVSRSQALWLFLTIQPTWSRSCFDEMSSGHVWNDRDVDLIDLRVRSITIQHYPVTQIEPHSHAASGACFLLATIQLLCLDVHVGNNLLCSFCAEKKPKFRNDTLFIIIIMQSSFNRTNLFEHGMHKTPPQNAVAMCLPNLFRFAARMFAIQYTPEDRTTAKSCPIVLY